MTEFSLEDKSQDEIDRYFLNLTIDLAKKAESINEVPVGAVLVSSDNKVVSKAYNKSIAKNDPTAHAEIIALRKAGKKLKNYRLINTTLYISLEPCSMCSAAISHARVSRIVFAANNNNLNKLNHKFAVKFIKNESYIKILKNFFKGKRN